MFHSIQKIALPGCLGWRGGFRFDSVRGAHLNLPLAD
jgi:hypothetical protein